MEGATCALTATRFRTFKMEIQKVFFTLPLAMGPRTEERFMALFHACVGHVYRLIESKDDFEAINQSSALTNIPGFSPWRCLSVFPQQPALQCT